MQFPKESLQFLKNLKKHNNRDWFAENKPVFTAAQTDAKAMYAAIRSNLETHDKIDAFKLYRIYRDVRFSKDKTPYQPHFAGSFSRTGAALRGGYYLRIRPGESFLAGGFWEPSKEDLLRIRQELELDATEMRNILSAKKFVSHFGGTFESYELKTAPRGFDKTHPDIDLIRKKGFVAVRKFTDAQVLAPNFLEEVASSFVVLRPFFNYMSDVLTTNANGESLLD